MDPKPEPKLKRGATEAGLGQEGSRESTARGAPDSVSRPLLLRRRAGPAASPGWLGALAPRLGAHAARRQASVGPGGGQARPSGRRNALRARRGSVPPGTDVSCALLRARFGSVQLGSGLLLAPPNCRSSRLGAPSGSAPLASEAAAPVAAGALGALCAGQERRGQARREVPSLALSPSRSLSLALSGPTSSPPPAAACWAL